MGTPPTTRRMKGTQSCQRWQFSGGEHKENPKAILQGPLTNMRYLLFEWLPTRGKPSKGACLFFEGKPHKHRKERLAKPVLLVACTKWVGSLRTGSFLEVLDLVSVSLTWVWGRKLTTGDRRFWSTLPIFAPQPLQTSALVGGPLRWCGLQSTLESKGLKSPNQPSKSPMLTAFEGDDAVSRLSAPTHWSFPVVALRTRRPHHPF